MNNAWGRRLLIAIPYLWLLALFLAPFLIVAKISLSDVAVSRPPYTPTFDPQTGWEGIKDLFSQFDFENFVWLTEDPLYYQAYVSSVVTAILATVLTLLIGFPLAYGIARAPGSWRYTLLMLIILPFWTSFLIRVYAWIGILKPEGLMNQFLMWTGLIETPIIMSELSLSQLLVWMGAIGEPWPVFNNNLSVYIVIVYSYLPFMVLPIYSALERMDYSLIEAAQDLGCSPLRAFWKVTAPLATPGIIAGSMLVFIPAVGEFVIPDLLGDSNTLMIGKTLSDEFRKNGDWPVASAVAIILLLILVVPIMYFQKVLARGQEAN